MSPQGGRRVELEGVITSVGFASGDRVVVGHWRTSPLGPFTDVMWARPDGVRVLLAPTADVLRFVTGVYRFDDERVVPIEAHLAEAPSRAVLEVSAGPLALRLQGGRRLPVPLGRRPALARWVHGPVARALLGVRTYGVTGSGVEEWYRAQGVRRVVDATGTCDGVDLGAFGAVRPAVGFGVSEPPSWPSMVSIRPLLRYPHARDVPGPDPTSGPPA